MRIHIGAIPDEFEPDTSWNKIHEPGPLLMQVVAVPIAALLVVSFGYLWSRLGQLSPLSVPRDYQLGFTAAVVLSFPALILVHEALHAVAHPGYGLQRETIIGAWPRKLLFYAHYSGPLTRDRFLLVFAMPFLVITVLPLIISALGLLRPPLGSIFAWFSVWNAFFACGDAVGFLLLLFQVPRDAIVQNKGWRTFWKRV